MNSNILRLASRKSDLARLQAYAVGRAIERAHPHIHIEYQFSTSLGDANLNDPLWKMPEKGVFTADLSEKLARGECDLVVHSWKDLPTEPNPRTEIAATLKRADVRDILLVKRRWMSQADLSGAASFDIKIYSSSPRREYNIGDFLRWSLPARLVGQEILFEPVRGNIATRAKKYLENADVAGWVVAKAALDRMLSSKDAEFADSRAILRKALNESRFQVLPVSECPAAPAQGALAIEIARNRDDMRTVLQAINDLSTWSDVRGEREIFRQYGGGCHQKIGVTFETRPFGQIQCGRGETIKGQAFSFLNLKVNRASVPPALKEHIFPLQLNENHFFAGRRAIAFDQSSLDGRDLFVSRADAWPKDFSANDEAIVWASGVQTWRKLARQDIWVSGCQDGRGEAEPTAIENLSDRALNFAKLTHRDGYHESRWPVVATYELIEKPESEWPDLSNKTHFYWSSFSQFERASHRYRDVLLKGYHACGPGNTFQLLQNVTSQVSVYLSHESWLEDIGAEHLT